MSEVSTTGQAARLTGLSAAEVAERTQRGQTNNTRFETSRSYPRIIFDNTASPVYLALFAISILLIAVGLTGDAILTAGLVLGNIFVGIFQESRAKRQLDRIALLTKPTATVIRDGEESTVDPAAIVLGDLLVVRAGDQILADGSILNEEGLSVDESLLTGESDVVRKHAGDPLHSGAFAMTGSAVMEVEEVGSGRLAQRITEQARSFKNLKTPLQQEVTIVVWVAALLVILLGIGVLDSFHDIYGRVPLVEGARAAAVIVALVPQGLWFMITVTYAMAAVRMSRTGALIQRMNAVESISHVDVLCFDKTGTLTTNALHVESIEPLTLSSEALEQRLGHFAASASFSNRTNAAIQEAFPRQPLSVRQEVVFDSARKWSALVLSDASLAGLYVLGAPEIIEPSLAGEATLDVDRWTSQGLRVLVLAGRDTPAGFVFDELDPRLPDGLQAFGLVVLKDELRAEAAATIARFREADIDLKIISGDNPETVAALARQANFDRELQAVSGQELAQGPETGLADLVNSTTVFGRIAPDQKEKLVRALQAQGKYVAMIGDGVNDVPALKQAEVAVSLRSASPVTRSVADILLMRDSFSVLPAAFLEGQRIRNGMVGIIKLFLVRVISVAIVILVAALLRDPFPVTPRHTALIAALTVGIPSLALAAWAKPARTDRRLVPMVAGFVLPAAVVLGASGAIGYWAYLSETDNLDRARTVLTAICTLAGITLIPFAGHSTTRWLDWRSFSESRAPIRIAVAMLIVFALTWVIPVTRRFYELEVLGVEDWLVVAGAVVGWAALLKLVWTIGAWIRPPPQRD